MIQVSATPEPPKSELPAPQDEVAQLLAGSLKAIWLSREALAKPIHAVPAFVVEAAP